jgi:hypothetical protein
MNAMKNANNEAAMLDLGFSEGKHAKRRRERTSLKNRKRKAIDQHAERNFKKAEASKALAAARKQHENRRKPIIEQDDYTTNMKGRKVTWKGLGMKPFTKQPKSDAWPKGNPACLSQPFKKSKNKDTPIMWDMSPTTDLWIKCETHPDYVAIDINNPYCEVIDVTHKIPDYVAINVNDEIKLNEKKGWPGIAVQYIRDKFGI